ncbi:hypothetical protein PC9H_008205 [Pleurotus ostreatus]|uniref:Major facilitator superfamily (MFS) profile domain-containing protein n=1 Tax=Pleurotus ostreatus TaxID=5322 RepID=A0A8H6ZWR6_PLEOS|nr:uncharacterized protein PC9H_008205 [Pleurotus ostreatus]KAF7428968.1 hypothetical protein PC9H_008205 [Pleurotus ostreatus]
MLTSNRFKNSRVYWHAFIAFWGIVLFGYDTFVDPALNNCFGFAYLDESTVGSLEVSTLRSRELDLAVDVLHSGVVANQYFREYFGLIVDGEIDQKRLDAVSSNVVSVLQAGAFFGALGSAPISAKLGRKWTLVVFAVVFIVGAILTTIAGGSNGLAEIYSGRVISGIGIGGISAVAPAYISECAPKNERGRITGLFQIMVTTGVMISYFINFGIGIHIHNDPKVWKIPFGVQLIPAGIMCFGLFTLKESPRWLASVDRNQDAIRSLAYLRKQPVDSPEVIHEMAEIEAAIEEERAARKGLGLKEAFFGKGNFVRFVVAFVIFLFQQLTGQNSINYYAPQIFTSIGYTGTKNSLLASGIYGVVKVITTSLFVLFFVDLIGRKRPLFASAMGMGIVFFITGAILKTHPPQDLPLDGPAPSPPPASQAMAAMLYIYVFFYSLGWGPLPWIYSSEIFPTRTRHYGLAVASASQWLWNFVISKVTPQMLSELHYKIFFVYGTLNIGALAVFALIIPETTGRSLEDMDVIFGSVTAEQRQNEIIRLEKALDAHHEDEGKAKEVTVRESGSVDEKV